MSKDERTGTPEKPEKIDYSSVTPATGTSATNMPVADSLANELPTADSPARDTSVRSDPDKIIPGSEAATGVDQAEEEKTKEK